MSSVIHVLIGRGLSNELSVACVAFVTQGPVLKGVHMLYGSLTVVEFAIARLAFFVVVHSDLHCSWRVVVKSSMNQRILGIVSSKS